VPSLFPDLIGACAAIQAVRGRLARLLEHIARTARWPTVLLLGETGTGKGLIARALHRASARAAQAFVALNCAAVPAPLFEAELFGVTRGAFTDARASRYGLLREAHGGTLFLDEIGALPLPLQAKLLTTIETREVRALGGTREESVDVWLLAATNADLGRAVQEGRFREDLYHRLAAIPITLPPLRDRGPDILALATHYLDRACVEYHLPGKALDPDTRAALLAYTWPGNVRELANVMERAALLTGDRPIAAGDLGLPGIRPASPAEMELPLGEAVAAVERAQLHAVWHDTKGNLSEAARRLGVPRNTLRYRLARRGVPRADRVGGPGPKAAAAPVMSVEPAGSRFVTLLDVTYDEEDTALAARGPRPELAGKIAAFGGEVIASRMDGYVAAFGIEPTEDAPFRAASAALAIRAAARRRMNDDAAFARVRLVLHAAPLPIARDALRRVVAGTRDDPTSLQAVLDALRAQAVWNEILVTEAVRPHLVRHFALTSEDNPVAAPIAQDVRKSDLGGHSR
jgi:transcriptional regulator with AAA-type ATPase domain